MKNVLVDTGFWYSYLGTREEFALQVELQSVHIETKEKEDGSIHYELELFFQDTEDTFAGHFLYADIEDHEVKEITLMG